MLPIKVRSFEEVSSGVQLRHLSAGVASKRWPQCQTRNKGGARGELDFAVGCDCRRPQSVRQDKTLFIGQVTRQIVIYCNVFVKRFAGRDDGIFDWLCHRDRRTRRLCVCLYLSQIRGCSIPRTYEANGTFFPNFITEVFERARRTEWKKRTMVRCEDSRR